MGRGEPGGAGDRKLKINREVLVLENQRSKGQGIKKVRVYFCRALY